MASLPPISIISPNVSDNPLGRALLLADLLRSETRVQIVGIQQAESLWAPAAGAQIPIRGFRTRPGLFHALDGASWLRDVVGDDFVIVSKPVARSLGLALLARVGARGMTVDIDDWQAAFVQRDQTREQPTPTQQRVARLRSYARRGGLNGFVFTRLLEEYARRRGAVTVSNRWLQERFGGELLYHVRDPNELDPSLSPSRELKPLPAERLWVGFVGTPRPHKGIGVLVDAVASANRSAPPLGLALMGIHDGGDPDVAYARKTLSEDALRILPPFPIDALRDHLALTDVLAVPSLEMPTAWGQIPAKLFDAMSMARPIVASSINDIPEILDGVGICVPPGDRAALAAALVRLARDVDLRRRLGAAARERLIERYSYDAGRRVLVDVVRKAAR
ncbi:MAG: glycosyltransferase family 4 protein [Myxococcota bacterium]